MKKTWMRAVRAAVPACAALSCLQSRAIDIDAGDYTALPEGTSVAALYVQHAERDRLYANGNAAPGNNRLNSDIGILRLIHFTKIGGLTVDPQLLLPFGRLQARGDLAAPLGSTHGTADLILAATVWLVEDPTNRSYFGITPFLYVPTGSYDANKALNLGENRWKYALQAAYIQGLSANTTLDVALDVTSYGSNDKATPAGDKLKQSASLQAQGFLRYNVSPAWDLRAGLSYAHQGETKVAGAGRNDAGSVTKLQLGTAGFVGPKTQLLATWGRDLRVTNGFKESNRLNVRLLQLF
ncbi:MAG: transporter [Nevskiaceae bacterium]|nr:MAG: transporter [Nevskiaceae bacterium]